MTLDRCRKNPLSDLAWACGEPHHRFLYAHPAGGPSVHRGRLSKRKPCRFDLRQLPLIANTRSLHCGLTAMLVGERQLRDKAEE